MFIIEDETHCELHGEFATLDEAVAELRRIAHIPWGQPPNVAPCVGWQACERRYVIMEVDNPALPWGVRPCGPVLEVSASGVKWAGGFEDAGESAGQSHVQDQSRAREEAVPLQVEPTPPSRSGL